jgi:pyruvate/2-oxoglutarate dehydrogenase complex dihydrolipoamide acyltransferase (E2) component
VATLIQMPKLGLTMTEGTISEWVAEAGQKVAAGDVVMMIETDKVEAEVEALADGVVHHSVEAGSTLEPGEGVGWLLSDGEAAPDDGPAAAPASSPAEAAEPKASTPATPAPEAAVKTAAAPAPVPGAPQGRLMASPNAKRVGAEMAVDLALVVGTGPNGRITSEDVLAAVPASRGLGGRILASPNAKRVASEMGVDLAGVVGSGPGGRITSEDIQASAADTLCGGSPRAVVAQAEARGASTIGSDRFVPFAASKAAERLGVDVAAVVGTGPAGRVSRQDVYNHARSHGGAVPPKVAPAASGPAAGDTVALKGMRGIIADRMHSSLQEMAQLTLAMDVDMDRAVELREQLKEIGADELGSVPGYTDFVIAAVARALQQHPGANAQIEGDHIRLLEEINVGMAVSVPDGLMVPVIHGTDQLGLADLAVETSRLASAARDKQLGLAEMEGGTFSVTALGMFGVDMFTPVINPPNAGILGVGRIRDDVAWTGDVPSRVKRMTISLTWDHRVLDGAPAAEFAQTIKSYLEQPLRLLG